MDPFIIWTLQRTGGTNLAVNLIQRSGLPTTAHEPLNEDRAFGHITLNWRAHNDESLLNSEVAQFLENGYAIKHCVENVDWTINQVLLRQSVQRGYGHFILFRENALSRLLSLHFAAETGVWGHKKAASFKRERHEETLEGFRVREMNINALVSHEETCIDRLFNIIKALVAENARICVASFEEIYEAPDSLSETKLQFILSTLGFPIEESVRELHNSIKRRGDQGTKKNYTQIPGRKELQRRLEHIASLKEMCLPAYRNIF